MDRNRPKRLLLIDGNNYINRAYHATPKKLTNKQGVPTNAVMGFINILMSDLFKIRPTHVCVVWDKHGTKEKYNWRLDVYPKYKANRKDWKDKTDKKTLERLRQLKEMHDQQPLLRKVLKAMGIRNLRKTGVEADDLMGTLAVEYAECGYQVIISSNDKDMAQVVSPLIHIQKPDRTMLDPKGVFREYGVRPAQIVEMLALAGDSVDNIIGIKGCGYKTAAKLLAKHGSMKKVIKNRKQESPAFIRECEKVLEDLKVTPSIIRLKLDTTHKVTAKELRFPNKAYDQDRLGSICAKYDMKKTFLQISSAYHKWMNS